MRTGYAAPPVSRPAKALFHYAGCAPYGASRPATQSRQISQKCADKIHPPAQQGIAFVYVARDTQPCLP
jgi:hypothetical protein